MSPAGQVPSACELTSSTVPVHVSPFPEPESELSLTSGKTGESSYAVAETGSLDGRVGFLGDFTGETITISGTWASGEQFNVDIKIQP